MSFGLFTIIHFVFVFELVLFFGQQRQTISLGSDTGQEAQTEAGWNLERLQGDGGGSVHSGDKEDLLGIHHQGGRLFSVL